VSPIPEGRLSRKLGVDGALSCWKIKDSPHISRTTGSVTGDNPLETIPPEITLLPKIPPEVPRPPTRVH